MKLPSPQNRAALDRQLMAETLDSLAAILIEPQAVVPHPIQPDSFQNLLAAVGAVGRALDLEIRSPVEVDLDPLCDPLEAISAASQIRVRRITLPVDWWKTAAGPLLGFSGEQVIALLPVQNTYEVYNPTQNTRIPLTAAFLKSLDSTAYTFYRPFPSALNAIELLRFAMCGRLKDLVTIVVMGIITTLLGMLSPQATGFLIDHAIPDANRNLLVQLGLGLFASTLGSIVFQWVQTIALLRFTTATDTDVQSALWDRLLKLPATFFRDYTIGDLSSRVSAVSQIHHLLSGTVLKTIFVGIFSVLNLGLLLSYNSKLALLAISIALVYMVITLLSGLLTLRKMRPLLAQQGLLLGVMVQIINGVSKLRVAGAEARAFNHWGKQYRQQLHLTLSTQQIEDVLHAVNSVLPGLTNVLIFFSATQMLQQGNTFSIGTFLAFNAAFGSFLSGATSLSSTVIDVLSIFPLWQRAQPILNATPEVNSDKRDPGKLSGRLAVDRVTFRYQSEGKAILKDISLRAEPGEFIAIVGASGSGKSTLFRLLLGFEQPASGRVLYDAQDLAGLDVYGVRRQLGVVLQNGQLNSASIFDNIVGNSLTTLEKAWEAADRAGLAADIQSMPMGIHTVVSEGGANLSGGQRQRLLIARALALKPKILLFDEATSALDNQTQAVVSASLDLLNVTRIAIAHRLSTIRHADRIYVLEEGRIVQEGSFEQLVQQPGLFTELIDRQTL
jgi:NHLM bacteriocin system ABC transporter ATP-binding protein